MVPKTMERRRKIPKKEEKMEFVKGKHYPTLKAIQKLKQKYKAKLDYTHWFSHYFREEPCRI